MEISITKKLKKVKDVINWLIQCDAFPTDAERKSGKVKIKTSNPQLK